jgi:hypothetical protein
VVRPHRTIDAAERGWRPAFKYGSGVLQQQLMHDPLVSAVFLDYEEDEAGTELKANYDRIDPYT